jgi:hypothetical protein
VRTTDYDYWTHVREDGATVSMPSGMVIAPPFWVQYVLDKMEIKWEWPEPPAVSR